MRRVVIANRRPHGLWWRVPVAVVVWLFVAVPLVAAVVGYLVVRDYARDLPRVPDLDRWEETVPRTSILVAADGTPLADIPFAESHSVGHRFPVGYDELPPSLVHAILAAEDVRFFSHRGVDLRAVIRALWANVRAGRVVEGGSTITQQLARNLLDEIGDERSLRRKVREAILAWRIERTYDKQRIFATYANYVFLGANAYGVAAAARAYFDAPLAELELHEAALIAGLIQAPGRTDPYLDPGAARTRRDEVLERMHRAGFIDRSELRAAAAAPIELSPPPVRYGTIAPWHTERARQWLEKRFPDAYRRGGLVVETTAEPVLGAEILEDSRRWTDELAGSGEPPQVGAVVWDHRTDYVEATVGGRSWEESRFDRATQACRQPGSAFKPIVYAAALDAGAITPATPLRDGPITVYDETNRVFWKPTNSGRRFRGVALAQDALAASLNAPAVDVLDRVGIDAVIDMAHRLGVESELAEVRPLALGASCVGILELARAYAAFASGGRRVEPLFVKRVRFGDAFVIDQASPFDPTLAPSRRLDRLVAHLDARDAEATLDPRVAFLVSSMLRDVVRRGTATAARSLGRPVAGKTGTTNDNTDAWFVGYTSRVVAAVWLGHDDPADGLGRRRDGGRAALPLWMRVVGAAERVRPAGPVPGEAPPGLERARVDRKTGLLAQPGAGGAIDLHFLDGTTPTEVLGRPTSQVRDLARSAREF